MSWTISLKTLLVRIKGNFAECKAIKKCEVTSWVVVMLLGLLSVASALACGIILPLPEDRVPKPAPGFSIHFRHTEATIVDGVVQVSAKQAFFNEAPYQREGIYLFPVPENSTVNRLALVIGSRIYEAELLNRDEAIRIYEQIVNARRDPALLEFLNRQTFRLRIFPFQPREEREVIVRYDQLLRRQGNTYRFVYPLRVERISDKPIHETTITVKIRSQLPIKTIYSPTHVVSVQRLSEKEAVVTYEAKNVREQNDFVLYYSVAEGEIGATLLPYRNRIDRDGYFLLFLSPKLEWEQNRILPKDVVFVFDRTGSMSGEKINQAKEALKFCVDRLNSNDRFNVVVFNENPDLLWKDLQVATIENKREAIQMVEQLAAQGGTNINEALLTAFPLLTDRERTRFVVFLTDGVPTVGETNVSKILENVKRANEAKIRTFVFGVGYDVNAVFLDRLASENNGVSVYVQPNENIEIKVSEFFNLFSEPILTDVKITFDGVNTHDVYPKQLPDLFRGSEIVLAGAYTGSGKTGVSITGRIGKREKTFTFNFELPDRETGNDFVPRIWASRKIGYLLDELAAKGTNSEIISEIIRLSKEFGVLTEFTAFLVNEPDIPLPVLLRQTEEKLRRATQEKTGSWAVAQALNRQILQRATADYDLAMGNQAPVRSQVQTSSTSLRKNPGAYTGENLGKAVIVGQSGEVEVIAGIKVIGNRAFVQQEQQWVDLRFDSSKHQLIKIQQFSKAVLQLLQVRPDLAKFVSLSDEIIVTVDDKLAIHIGKTGKSQLSEDDLRILKTSM